MKKFEVISKIGCSRCEMLKNWLKQNKISYDEWKLEDEKVKSKLLNDPKFIKNFCDIDGCMVYTPVIHLTDSGEYFFKELFNQTGVRASFLKEKLELK